MQGHHKTLDKSANSGMNGRADRTSVWTALVRIPSWLPQQSKMQRPVAPTVIVSLDFLAASWP